jgi:hypothetical protein
MRQLRTPITLPRQQQSLPGAADASNISSNFICSAKVSQAFCHIIDGKRMKK